MTVWMDLLATPFEVGPVDAGGIATRSLRCGPEDGEPVVFLHGTSGHLEAFARNLAVHAEAGYRCHAIDMLGHGFTDKPDRPYEIPDYVAHLEAYLDAIGAESAHIVGESLGGWVGAWLASERGERLRTLQLLAAGGTKANPEVMERIASSTRRAVVSDDPQLVRERLELLMHDPADATDELVAVRTAIYHAPAFRANVENLLSLQDMERRQRNLLRPDRMARITVPTLIVWGRENPFGEVPEAHAMHEAIAGSRLELFERCGHWPQHERADLYNPLSLEFLAAG